jgi:GNAT superfamily N-acetyltransferase
VEFRRAGLYASGTLWKDYLLKAQYDFAGGDADWKDVYLGMENIPVVGTLLVGQMHEPFSLEELTSSNYITFMERSLPTGAFALSRKTGIRASDAVLSKRMTWAVRHLGYQMINLISCRKADKSDLPEILRLYAQPDIDDGNVLSQPEAENFFEQFSRYPDYKIYVAVLKGKIVGTFALLIMENLGHMGAPSAIIEDVAVDPGFQEQGIGKTMIRQALDMAKARGCYKAMLSSNLKRTRAHKFYEALGFDRHGYSFRIDL